MNPKSRKTTSRVAISVTTALATSVLSSLSNAQEEDSESNDANMEVIMVSAQLRQESLQEVPISMSVATAEQLERDQINTLLDLQRIAPGLEIQPAFGGDASGGGRIRGIGTNIFNEGVSGSVAVVVDDVPSGNIAMPSIFDMSQVEVLRGPQGTLFGQSASVGVIKITTRAPDTYGFSGYASINHSWEDFDQTLFEGSVNVPITDNSALRLSMRSDVQDGQYNSLLEQRNESDTLSMRARYLWEVTPELKIDLTAEHHDIDRNHDFFTISTPPLISISAGPPSSRTPEGQLEVLLNCGDNGSIELQENGEEYCSTEMPTQTLEFTSIVSNIEWTADDFVLTSISSYREKKLDDEYLNYTRIVFSGPIATVRNTGRDGEQWTQEFRFTSNNDGKFNYIGGLFFSNYNTNTYPTNGGEPGNLNNPAGFGLCDAARTFCNGPFPNFTFEDIDISVQALFFDGTYDFTEKLSVFGGLRLTKQSADYEFTDVNSSPVVSTQAGSKDDSEPSGRLGVRYKASKNSMYYASVSRGFKGSLVSQNDNPAAPLTILDPEISTSFELGNKLSVLDNSLVFDSNVFYMTVDNYQAQTAFLIEGELIYLPTSVSEVESYGVELNARGNLTDTLSINAGYIYNRALYPDGYLSDDPISLGGPQDLGGEQLYLAPEQKLTISADYYKEISNGIELFTTVNAIYKSDILMAQRAQEEYVYDAHWNIGGSVGVRSSDGTWNVSLYGRNLTDEPFPVAVLASQVFGQENGGTRVLPGPGITNRQIGVLARYNF